MPPRWPEPLASASIATNTPRSGDPEHGDDVDIQRARRLCSVYVSGMATSDSPQASTTRSRMAGARAESSHEADGERQADAEAIAGRKVKNGGGRPDHPQREELCS